MNYKFDFEDSILDAFFGKPIYYFYKFLFFAFSYYAIAIPQAIILKVDYLKKKKFWFLSLAFIGLIACGSAFYQYHFVADLFDSALEKRFILRLTAQIKRLLIYTIPLIILAIFYRQKPHQMYGLIRKGFRFKPYLILFAIVVPLIILASFQPDFLKVYPKFNPNKFQEVFGWKKIQMATVFELFYGMGFFSVKLIFRGALVIALGNIVLGRHSILPMAVCYAFLHFGKPLGETISSIFGGYILGVIALYSKNIWGGVLIHVGIAWVMEIAAFFQIVSD